LPNDAKNVKTSKYTTISIAYITNKAPSKEVLEAKNEGYELVAVTHPADYVTNEKIAIKLLLNGKPVKGQELTIEREGTQYRASADVLELTSNKKGLVEFTLPVGGRYMLESVHEQKSTDPEADTDTTRVFYSFEVIHE
jgi:uncharacterized GH25 family protein